MNTIERKEYLKNELVNCSEEQRQRAISKLDQSETYNMIPTDKDYIKWVADTKASLHNEASPEKISEVFNYLRV